MELLLVLILKNIQELETLKKIPYISGNRNLKKASQILGNETFQFIPKNFLIPQGKKTLKKISYIFSKERFSYISRNENPKTKTLKSFFHFRR